jgi:hypothetical protein
MNSLKNHWKRKLILRKPEKAQTFVLEPIEGFNLEPRLLTWTFSNHKKLKIRRPTKLVQYKFNTKYKLRFRMADGGRQSEDRRNFFSLKITILSIRTALQ